MHKIWGMSGTTMCGVEKIFKMNTLIENIRVIPDFSKVQILQLIGNPDILVLTTGKMGGDTREIYYFEGVFLTEGNGRKIGEIADALDKDKFEIFNGRLILQNDEN